MNTRGPAETEAAVAAAVSALGLRRPEITELAGGVVNRSFRIRDGDQDYVLRLAGDAVTGLGANASSELAMNALAAGAGLAPPIVLADTTRGIIVSRHAAGRTPGRMDTRNPQFLRRLGGWIERLHALDPPSGLPVIDFGERAAGCLARAMSRRPDRVLQRLAAALERRRAALPPPVRFTACHHDLHHRNLLDDGRRLFAVDWEYAGPGDPAADLASCIGYHDLDATQVDSLLAGYGPDSGSLRERIAALGWIFDCLWFGWNATAQLAGLEVDPGEQSRLAARLMG